MPMADRGRLAVFIDRDDTINKDVPYCARPEDFVLLPTAAEAIRLLNQALVPVIVVTNQSGIGRGYFDETTLSRIHDKMRSDLAAHGAKVAAVYHCPHTPDAGCNCRKPKIGMALVAAKEHALHLPSCYMIGDRVSDLRFGRAMGATTVVVPSIRGGQELAESGEKPDHLASDALDAVNWILRKINAQAK